MNKERTAESDGFGDNSTEIAASERGRRRREWLRIALSVVTRLAGIGAIIISLGGVALYVAGVFAQNSYLSYFSIDPDGFPRSSDWLAVRGYFFTFERLFSIVSQLSWKLLLVYFGVVTYLIVLFRWQPKPRKVRKIILPWWLELGGWTRIIGSSVMYAGWALVVSYFAFILALVVAMFPALIGGSAGRSAAIADASKYAEGCSQEQPCTELLLNGEVVGSGFILAISLEHVALWDARNGRVRVVPRHGLELSTPVPGN